jgi:hypothetical protein
MDYIKVTDWLEPHDQYQIEDLHKQNLAHKIEDHTFHYPQNLAHKIEDQQLLYLISIWTSWNMNWNSHALPT